MSQSEEMKVVKGLPAKKDKQKNKMSGNITDTSHQFH
jgi:hypothetical protein